MTARLSRRLGTLHHRIDATGSLRAVEVLRIAAGPLVILHLRPFLDAASNGLIYSDRFFQPFVSWYPEVTRHTYLILLRGCVVAAVLVSLGLFTRAATTYVAAFVGYNLFLSVTHFHHNRAFLLTLLVALAVLGVGREVSIDSVLFDRRGGARLWPLWLLRFEVMVVYGASGLSKLVDGDWWGGLVTRLRVEQWSDVAAAKGTPQWLLDLVSTEGFHWWFAKAAVATELFIAAGLVFRRTRLGAIWVAIVFHVAVEITAEVQVFSWAALAALVIWVTPSNDRRLVEVPASPWLIRRLDWLGRFEVVSGSRFALHEHGVTLVGAPALRVVLSRLPVTFWFVAPFAGLRRVWDRRPDPKKGRRLR